MYYFLQKNNYDPRKWHKGKDETVESFFEKKEDKSNALFDFQLKAKTANTRRVKKYGLIENELGINLPGKDNIKKKVKYHSMKQMIAKELAPKVRDRQLNKAAKRKFSRTVSMREVSSEAR